MTIQKPTIDQKMFDKHASHPLQSWAWGEFRTAMGVDLVRTPFGQLTFHDIPHTHAVIGYFPKGPLPTRRMLEALETIGKKKHAVFIQLEPDVPVQEKISIGNNHDLRASHRPLFTKYTFVLDLTKSEEELLSNMHQKTRYNIRVAKKHGVIVQEDNSPKAFLAYLALNKETTRRQGFYAHDETYHSTMWRIMHAANIARLFTATYHGHILAAWIVFCWKHTIYYPYGASSRNHREVMAPVLLLWEIARWGKRHGYTAFDLWGALGPHPNPKNPWYGFHRFKQGFSPDLLTSIGSFDLVQQPAMYRIYQVADSFRWFFLRIKAKK